MSVQLLASRIRDVPDFPKPGIVFKDLTPLLLDPVAFAQSLDHLLEPLAAETIDVVVGIEARGFLFGIAAAQRLGVGFVPVRKPGKLPGQTNSASYHLEYGSDQLEIHHDAISPGQRVLLIDDVLATGGTAKAAADLISGLGGQLVLAAFLIELPSLKGRELIADIPVHSVLTL